MAYMVPIVEVAFASLPLDSDPVWTDITDHVHFEPLISINRGRSDELSAIQAGTCTLTLDNSDARFTVGNTGSPYYPNVRKGKRIRVRVVHVDTNYVTNPSFETDDSDWDPGDASSAIIASDNHHGTQCAEITWAGVPGEAFGTTLYGLEAGQQYTASAWIKRVTGGPAVQLGVDGIGTGTASATTSVWEKLTYTFTATSHRHTLQLTPVGTPAAASQTRLDEVQVNDGATAEAFSPTGALLSSRYDGFVNRWPVEWPGGGKVSKSAITCTDLFKRLGQDNLRSFLEEEILADEPNAYWTLAESSSSATAGDSAGIDAGALSQVQLGSAGTLAFGSGTGPGADGLTAPVFTPTDGTNGLYLNGSLGPDFEYRSSSEFITLEAWFSTSTVSRTILGVRSADNVFRLRLALNASGQVQINTTANNGATVSSYTWASSSLANAAVHHVIYVESTKKLFVDGVDLGAATGLDNLFRVVNIQVGALTESGLWNGTISHVAAYLSSDFVAADALRHYQAGATGHAGDGVDDRVARIAGYVGITSITSAGTLFGSLASQGAGASSPLALMQAAADTESAQLFANRTGGLTVQARDLRYQQTATLTLDGADLEGPPSYADDDQFLINEVRAGRPGGATLTVKDDTSRTHYGRYPRALSLLKQSDSGTHEAASWMLQRYKDPLPRLRSLPVEGYRLGTTTYRALLELDISSAVEVTNLPSQAPNSTEQVCLEGVVETIGPQWHQFTWHTSPSSRDQVWILQDSELSVLDETTVLAY